MLDIFGQSIKIEGNRTIEDIEWQSIGYWGTKYRILRTKAQDKTECLCVKYRTTQDIEGQNTVVYDIER